VPVAGFFLFEAGKLRARPILLGQEDFQVPKLVVWQRVETEFKGRTIEGLYGISNRMVIVRYEGDSKATQVGGSALAIARILLRELAEKAERDSQ
jgi:hypothetical protein